MTPNLYIKAHLAEVEEKSGKNNPSNQRKKGGEGGG